jgi:hypothetical protein
VRKVLLERFAGILEAGSIKDPQAIRVRRHIATCGAQRSRHILHQILRGGSFGGNGSAHHGSGRAIRIGVERILFWAGLAATDSPVS